MEIKDKLSNINHRLNQAEQIIHTTRKRINQLKKELTQKLK